MGAIRRTRPNGRACPWHCAFRNSTSIDRRPDVATAAGSPSVTTTTLTFVDTSRSTPPWNGVPGQTLPDPRDHRVVSGGGIQLGHDHPATVPTH